MRNSIKLTVATIVYNGEDVIEKTILSVINQSYNNIEYIVINGKSTDKTHQLILKYKSRIDKYINEPDKGVYDAMNKAIKLSTGDYINFLNAGDTFFDNHSLELMFNIKRVDDILYGKRISVYKDHNQESSPQDINTLWKGMTFCHQASFVKTSLYQKYYFDLQYKVSSVYDFFYKCYNEGVSFNFIDKTIVYYDMNGISATSWVWFKDYFRIAWKHAPKKRLNILIRTALLLVKRVLVLNN